MYRTINYFQQLLHALLSSYFKLDDKAISHDKPDKTWLYTLLPEHLSVSVEEELVLLLALMPHISPQTLDLLFVRNKEIDHPYTEFGGCSTALHSGFLPTGQTAVFLLTQLAAIREKDKTDLLENEKSKSKEASFNPLLSLLALCAKEHWFHKENILHLESKGEGEPFLSRKLCVSDDMLARVYRQKYEPEYNADFPAKKISTPLEWQDLVLPFNLREELDDIICWLKNQQTIREKWALNKIIRQGYRCLFYGPPGTGKTLTATLLGKQNNVDVYRVDLSMIVSKYIGETEKNLAKIFDKAEHQNWILFFDEADALFGQRTETQSSNDRYANQEVAYLLQRIEDFPGIVILASNLKENIDSAFFRRFQSALYFPIPDERLRYQLWKNMLPAEWLPQHEEAFIRKIASYKLSGGSIVNVVQRCAIKLFEKTPPILSENVFKQALMKEQQKEGKILS